MTTRTLFRRVLAASLVLLPVLAGARQTPVFRARSALVQVPVTALDRKGHFISGLKLPDFRLTVDGRPVPIDALDRVRRTETAAVSHPSLPPGVYTNDAARAPAGRLILLYDYDHTPLKFLPYLREKLLRWFRRDLPPGEQVAVFAFNHGLEVLQPFTTDRRALRATLDTMVSFHTGVDPYGSVQQELTQLNRIAGLSSEPAAAGEAVTGDVNLSPGANGTTAAAAQWSAADLARVQQVMTRGQYASSMRELSDLASLLEGVPGRKTVVWLTAHTSLNAVWNPKLGLTGQQRDLAFSRLNQADVALFPVDVSGLRVNLLLATTASMGRRPVIRGLNRQERRTRTAMGMRAAAQWTGGEAFVNNNGFGRVLTRIVHSTEESYVLSFIPPPSRRGHPWRTLKLTVPGHKVTLLYRRQYLEPAIADAREPDARFIASLRRLALTPMDLGGVPMALRLLPPGKRQTVRLDGNGPKTEVRSHGFVMVMPYEPLLHAVPGARGGNAFDFTCYRVLVPLDDPGRIFVFPPSRFTHQLTTAQRAALSQQAAQYENTFPAPIGALYLARVIIRDNLTGQLGSISFRIDERPKK